MSSVGFLTQTFLDLAAARLRLQLGQLEQRRRAVTGEIDRGYDHFSSGGISEEL